MEDQDPFKEFGGTVITKSEQDKDPFAEFGGKTIKKKAVTKPTTGGSVSGTGGLKTGSPFGFASGSQPEAFDFTKAPVPQQQPQVPARSGYESWKSSLPSRLRSEVDYDLKGYYNKYGASKVKGDEHLTDEFKLPNHPTFSTESVYYNENTKNKAGEWKGDTYVPFDEERQAYDEKNDRYIDNPRRKQKPVEPLTKFPSFTPTLGRQQQVGLTPQVGATGGFMQDIQANQEGRYSPNQEAMSQKLNKINQMYDKAQGKPSTQQTQQDTRTQGNITTGIPSEERKGNKATFLYNEILNGVGSMAAGLGDLMLQSGNNASMYNPALTAEPKTAEQVAGDAEALRNYRLNVAPSVRNFLTKNIGGDLDEGKKAQYQEGMFTAALGGLARSSPAIAATLASGGIGTGAMFLQSYDNALESINQSQEGQNLDDATKTYFATGVGIVTAGLEKFGLDRIFKSETGIIGNLLAKQALKKATAETGGKVTGDIFTKFLDREVLSLSNKYLKGGVRALDGALVEYTTESLQEGAQAGAELLVNKATGKPVFDTSKTDNWKGFLQRMNKAGVLGAIGGGLLGGAAGLANLNKANIEKTEQSLNEVNAALDNENLSEASQKALIDNKIALESELEKASTKIDETFDKLDDKQKERVIEITDRKVEIAEVLNDESLPDSVKSKLVEEDSALDKELISINPAKIKEESTQTKETITPIKGSSDVVVGDEVQLENGKRGTVIEINGENIKFDLADGGTITTSKPEFLGMSKVNVEEKVAESPASNEITAEAVIEPTEGSTLSDGINEMIKEADEKGETSEEIEFLRNYSNKEKADILNDVDSYIRNDHDIINSILRDGEKLSLESVSKRSKRTSNHAIEEQYKDLLEVYNKLDKGIESSEFINNKGETTLYRNIFRNNDIFKNAAVGDVVTDPAFMSTTVDSEWAKNHNNVSTTLEIKIPKGQKAKGLYVGKSEMEFILPRGTTLQITDIQNKDGKQNIVATLINQNETVQQKNDTTTKETVSEERTEEVIAKADTDLQTLKQVKDKTKKHEASLKRLTEAKNKGEISEKQFNDYKKKFDQVLAESQVVDVTDQGEKIPTEELTQTQEETTNATEIREIEQGSEPKREGTAEQQQGKQTDRVNQEANVTTGKAEASSSDSITEGRKEQEKIKQIQEKRQSVKDRISQKLKDQRGNLSSGFDPSLLKDFIELGSTYIEEGVVKASDFIKRFREDYKDMGFDESTITDEDITKEVFDKLVDTTTTEDNVVDRVVPSDIRKLDRLAHQNLEGTNVADTASNQAREKGTTLTEEESEYNIQETMKTIYHGQDIVNEAKEVFGIDGYVKGLLDYIDDNAGTLSVENKQLMYVMLENDLNARKNLDPENLTIKKQEKLVSDKSRAFGRSAARATAMGRLRQLARVGYDLSQVTEEFFSPKELIERTKIEQAVQSTSEDVTQEAIKQEQELAQEEASEDRPTGEKLKKAREEVRKAKDEFSAFLKRNRGQFNSGADVAGFVAQAAKLMKAYAKLGIVKVEDVLSEMRKDYGDDFVTKNEENLRSAHDVVNTKRYQTEEQKIKAQTTRLTNEIKELDRQIENGERDLDKAKNPAVANDKINELREEKRKKREQLDEIDPKPKDIVKQGLIDAGYGREITVTKNEKDANGNNVLDENGKPKKIKEKREIVDWKKLTGEEGSLDNINKVVDKVLAGKGYTSEEITRMKDALKDEYNDLHASIIEKAQNELKNRNTPKEGSTKILARRLADLYNMGLFDENSDTYDYLVNQTLGVSIKDQELFFQIKDLHKSLAEIVNARNENGDKLSNIALSTAEAKVKNDIKKLIQKVAFSSGNGFFKATVIVKNIVGAMQRTLLNRMGQLVENPASAAMNDAQIDLQDMATKGQFDTKELARHRRMLAVIMYDNITSGRGEEYGGVGSPFSTKNALDDAIRSLSPNHLFQALYSATTGTAFLDSSDSAFKIKRTELEFTHNLIRVLTDPSNPNGAMTKNEALQFVSESLTGQSFAEAKKTAKKLITDINTKAGKEILIDSDTNIARIANDIVKDSLVKGSKITSEMVEASFKAAYTTAGHGLGHESNNFVTRGLQVLNRSIETDLNDAIKRKEFNRAALLNMASILVKNIINPFAGGGANWTIIGLQKAGLPVHYLDPKTYQNKTIDLSTVEGLRDLERTLQTRATLQRNNGRTIVAGTTALILAAAAYGTGSDDEIRKYRKKHPVMEKYLARVLPPLLMYMTSQKKDQNTKGKIKQGLTLLGDRAGGYTDKMRALSAAKDFFDGKTDKGAYRVGDLVGNRVNFPFASAGMYTDVRDLYREFKGLSPIKTDKEKKGFWNGVFKKGWWDVFTTKEPKK